MILEMCQALRNPLRGGYLLGLQGIQSPQQDCTNQSRDCIVKSVRVRFGETAAQQVYRRRRIAVKAPVTECRGPVGPGDVKLVAQLPSRNRSHSARWRRR